MARARQHNEWFRKVSKPVCPCGASVKRHGIESVWSWGEYICGKWRTVDHFCERCFHTSVFVRVSGHTVTCGCMVHLIGYRGEVLPSWLTLKTACHKDASNG